MKKTISSLGYLIIIFVISFLSGNAVAQYNHGNNNNNVAVQDTGKTAIDPVCKMIIEKNDSLSINYNNKAYYFCSEKDMKIFLKSPQKFVIEDKSEQSDEHSHGMMGMSTLMMIIMGSVMAVMMIAGMIFLKK